MQLCICRGAQDWSHAWQKALGLVGILVSGGCADSVIVSMGRWFGTGKVNGHARE